MVSYFTFKAYGSFWGHFYVMYEAQVEVQLLHYQRLKKCMNFQHMRSVCTCSVRFTSKYFLSNYNSIFNFVVHMFITSTQKI